jgi:hypothetical protein
MVPLLEILDGMRFAYQSGVVSALHLSQAAEKVSKVIKGWEFRVARITRFPQFTLLGSRGYDRLL